MGFDPLNLSDWLNDYGICEAQINNLIDNFNNPNYRNVLRRAFVQPQHPMMGGAPVQMPQYTQGVNPMMNMIG